MGIAILVAVAALLAAFSGYLIKAAFVFSDIVMSVVTGMFKNGNFFEGFLSQSSSAIMSRGLADFSYIALALAGGIILINFVIGILRSMTAPMLNEKAEPIGSVIGNALKAYVMILLFYGANISIINGKTAAETGITLRSTIQGGLIGIYSRLLGVMGNHFTTGIEHIGSVEEGFTVNVAHPVLCLIILVLAVAAFSSIIGAAVTFLERVYAIVIQMVIGPICLAFYSGQDTKDIPKMWMTQLIGMALAMIVSLWLWGIMLNICVFMTNIYDTVGSPDILDTRELPLIGGLLSFVMIPGVNAVTNAIMSYFPGIKEAVIQSYYQVTVLLLLVVMLGQLIKNSERIFNSVGIKTAPSGDLARAVIVGMGGTMMALRTANGIAAATGRTVGAFANGTHPLQQVYTAGRNYYNGNSSLPKLAATAQGQKNISSILTKADSSGSFVGKNAINSQLGRNPIGLGGTSLLASSDIVPARVGNKTAGAYMTGNGEVALVGSFSKKDLESGVSISQAHGQSLGLQAGTLGADGRYHLNGKFDMSSADESGKFAIATGKFTDTTGVDYYGNREAHNTRALNDFFTQSHAADINKSPDAKPFDIEGYKYDESTAADMLKGISEQINSPENLDRFRTAINSGKYDDLIGELSGSDSFRDMGKLEQAFFDDIIPDDQKGGFTSMDEFKEAMYAEAQLMGDDPWIKGSVDGIGYELDNNVASVMKDFYGADDEGDKIQQILVEDVDTHDVGVLNEYEELMSGNDNTPQHREYNDGGYEDSSFGYGSDYDKDTDDLYQFDEQDFTDREEHSSEAPGAEYEDFMEDVFDGQYESEEKQNT